MFGLRKETEYSLKIDSIAPNMPEVSIVGTKGDSDWYNSDVEITTKLKGDSGGSGEQPYSYIVEKDGGVIAEGNNMASESTITLTEEGINVVKIIARDGAGNETIYEQEIKIDKTAPNEPSITIYGEVGDNDWYVSENVEVVVDLMGDMGGSGVSRFSYSVTVDGNVVSEQSNVTTGHRFILDNEGTNVVEITVKDNAGNETIYKQEIKIDKTAPNMPSATIRGTLGDNDWYVSDVKAKVVLSVNPNESVSYKIISNGYTIEENSDISNGDIITLTEEGINFLIITVKDNAGNETIYEQEIKIDKTAPGSPILDILGDMQQDNWYKGDVEVYVYSSGDSGGSGFKTFSYMLELNGDVVIEETTISNGTKITLSQSGISRLTLYVKDNAGNTSTVVEEIKIDNSLPTLPIINIPDEIEHDFGPTVHVYNSDVDIDITPGIDAVDVVESGTKKTTYIIMKDGYTYIAETEGTSFTITESGTYVVIARTYDKVNNYSEATVVIMMQKEPPEELQIETINGEDAIYVTQDRQEITVNVSNFTGEYITMMVTGPDGAREVTSTTDSISITVSLVGEYTLSLTQTNEYKKTSNPVYGSYTYAVE